jgi:catechol 2,3-dioxygenase-like lactoylglutathione lyase family enzyme
MNRVETDSAADAAGRETVDLGLEVVVIPVEDVDRAKSFYERLGWRLDADFALGADFRVVQFTPPGSTCSVHFGRALPYERLLVVADVEAARAELTARGVDVAGPYHRDPQTLELVAGVAPDRASYGTFASFRDTEGNTWFLQEVTTRLPGRVDGGGTTYHSPDDLAAALRRAEAAHGEHERRTGERDENWPAWYAEYMVRERAGEPLPH